MNTTQFNKPSVREQDNDVERRHAVERISGDRILSDLYAGAADLKRLAKRLGLSLGELSQWASTEQGARSLSALRRLADQRAGLALSKAKADAARALLKLARQNESKETARKACVDLLRLTAESAPAPAERDDDQPSPEEQRAWREALEGVGLASTTPNDRAASAPNAERCSQDRPS